MSTIRTGGVSIRRQATVLPIVGNHGIGKRVDLVVASDLIIAGCIVGCYLTGAAATHMTSCLRLKTHDFTGDATTMRSLTDSRQDRADRFDQVIESFGVREVHGSLNDIVCKGIAEHLFQLGRNKHLQDQCTADMILCSADALLNHVGTELLLGQGGDLTLEALADGLDEVGLSQIHYASKYAYT